MINKEEIKKITTIEEIKYLKSLACQKQMFELAAFARDHEVYLLSKEGHFWAAQENAKRKAEQREQKLKRIRYKSGYNDYIVDINLFV